MTSSKNKTINQVEINNELYEVTVKSIDHVEGLKDNVYIKSEIDKKLETLDIAATDESITLVKDLYAYTNIGKITGASNTNPVPVAYAGDSLKTVFDKVFGTQQDQNPSVYCNTAITVEDGINSFGGGEYGSSVAETTATITFTVTNDTGTCSYGYKVGDTKYKDNNTFYYPITKQNNADIKIILPSGKTASSSMVIAGSYVSHSSNILYCNFDSNKQVSIQISLSADTVGTSKKTRYGQVTGEVVFGTAQTARTNGSTITKFLTFLGEDYSDTSKLDGTDCSETSSNYTISAGYIPYTYVLASSTPDSLPTANREESSPTSITVSGGNANTYLYIFVPSDKSDITSIKSGGFGVPFSKVETSKSYSVNNSKTAIYKVFKTSGNVASGTFDIED
jgi:hypothetical protein